MASRNKEMLAAIHRCTGLRLGGEKGRELHAKRTAASQEERFGSAPVSPPPALCPRGRLAAGGHDGIMFAWETLSGGREGRREGLSQGSTPVIKSTVHPSAREPAAILDLWPWMTGDCVEKLKKMYMSEMGYTMAGLVGLLESCRKYQGWTDQRATFFAVVFFDSLSGCKTSASSWIAFIVHSCTVHDHDTPLLLHHRRFIDDDDHAAPPASFCSWSQQQRPPATPAAARRPDLDHGRACRCVRA